MTNLLIAGRRGRVGQIRREVGNDFPPEPAPEFVDARTGEIHDEERVVTRGVYETNRCGDELRQWDRLKGAF